MGSRAGWTLVVLGLLNLMAAVTGGACAPELREGRYGCRPAESGSCPDGWVCLPLGVEHQCFRDYVATCGNGEIEPGEQCDGTSFPDHACEAIGAPGGQPHCMAFCALYCTSCGDGVVNPGEDCDAGEQNADTPDAPCRTDCTDRRCGDGILDSGEECDHGVHNADTPDAPCRPRCWLPRCGDGVVDTGEACDDGARIPGDGCSGTCQVEDGYACYGTTGSICLDAAFAVIPAGSYWMGSPEDEVGHTEWEPLREVTLTRDFEIQTTEVTRAQFLALSGYDPSDATECGSACPVQNLNWHEAAAYTVRLSDLVGLPPCYTCTEFSSPADVFCVENLYPSPYECPGYRLPTSAEWEHAARAGTTEGTYNGDLIRYECEPTNAVLNPIAWFCGNSLGRQHPVASKQPNTWGLYDMLGSLTEWTDDWVLSESAVILNQEMVDPWWGLPASFRVVRGGSLAHHALSCRSGRLAGIAPPSRYPYLGFRPARTR